jgi:hypothetical protein
MAKERLFPIQGCDYETGVCADGRQVIMGLLCPDVVAVFFDAQGTYLGCEERRWSAAGKLAGTKPPYRIGGDRFRELIAAQTKKWQTALGFRAATIRVKKFWLRGCGVGIEELPGWAREIETADWITDEDERQQYRESRDQWIADGNFVFWWARSYHMSSDGRVEST